jgi:YbgC/YbaW family acyl-CoA thioester hydrolase
MAEHFTVRIAVRSYELDANGHVNHANYHRYGEHARTEQLRAAGCSLVQLVQHGLGLVMLETHATFLRELREGDQLAADSRFAFGSGRTFQNDHTLRRDDGVIVAEISCRVGLIDASTRRLVPDPQTRLLALATAPEVLGLG